MSRISISLLAMTTTFALAGGNSEKVSIDESINANDLGVAYYYGDGVDKDRAKAFRLIEDFAEKHRDPVSLYNLGTMYFFANDDTPYDKTKGLSYIKESAELGYPEAQLSYSTHAYWIPELGEEVSKVWLKKAAEAGQAEAQYQLGFSISHSVERNLKSAIYWYKQAAEKGWVSAQVKLADAYFKLAGEEQSYYMLELSYMWYEVAARNGNEYSQSFKRDVASLLSYDDIQKAKLLADSVDAPPKRLGKWKLHKLEVF